MSSVISAPEITISGSPYDSPGIVDILPGIQEGQSFQGVWIFFLKR